MVKDVDPVRSQFEANASDINTILNGDGFFPVSNSQFPGSSSTYNAPFCEDFNEAMLCSGDVNSNIDGCTATVTSGNAGTWTNSTACASGTGGCTSASGTNGGVIASNSTVSLPTAGSVCGNGIVEPFEECDISASANGGSGQNCSNICRCANGFTYRSVGGTWQCTE